MLRAGSIWQQFLHSENVLFPILLLDIFVSGCDVRTVTIFLPHEEEISLRTKTNPLDGKVENVKETGP